MSMDLTCFKSQMYEVGRLRDSYMKIWEMLLGIFVVVHQQDFLCIYCP